MFNNMEHFLMRYVYLGFFMFVTEIYCDTKIWKPSIDISDHLNWKQRFEDKNDCIGLTFAEINSATVFVESLRVKEIILPTSGVLEFEDDNSYIQIDDMSEDDFNCVWLKSISQKDWGDFENWRSTDDLDNPAVPHTRRLPCANDNVIFPHGANTSIFYDQYLTFRGKRFKIGEDLYEKTEFEDFVDGPTGREIFKRSQDILIEEPSTECSIPSTKVCQLANDKNVIKCQTPVTPHDFCRGFQICGGYILIDERSVDRIKKKLDQQDYGSSIYASHIFKDGKEKVQVVFTEKDFSGKSLDEIQHFHGLLLQEKLLSSQNVQLFLSGHYYEEGLLLKSTLLVIFGSLVAVMVMFGVLFYTYGTQKGEFTLAALRNRFAGSRPLSTYIFAKYDNLEEQARIFEGQSIAGSVVSLQKSNDRIDRSKYLDSPATSTASLDTIAPKEDSISAEKMAKNANGRKFSEIELSDRKESSVEDIDDDLLLQEL